MSSYQTVLLAAGQGKRMQAGRNKQFLTIAGTPLLIHTLRVFEEDSFCQAVVLVANDKETEEIRALLQEWGLGKKTSIVSGGKERQDSVSCGLKALLENGAGGEETVLIHDAARPFVTKDKLRQLAEEAASSGAAILAVRVKDTVKEVTGGTITKTVDRSRLWAAQTPQAFSFEVIASAHRKAEENDYLGTDDASLVEYTGGAVTIVEGTYENFKVTTPEDMMFAEAVVRSRQEGERK
ncbi:2-C-methyl-D-erythritol 4-phosphate cytidylyltransferase [Alkalicoccus saliphilus]|jgi:2-C-methyl-D-erythritol 4-phosphate cytidylyltransferase|uniref:2-C-methyl-D-erythritol 4-phosphate cytidylyltransferase n=1 Tax=Alkalicoccus saliphilus TaxID=200989 RepID=A0A2T4U511_9BACI|nr:2-C-methyl-D-erythritol 4-phosphate cytidylyltransferase [Alkalicoccus saliphilus]PTL38488.1 2-C-methyl-D-erythritol 4-phosphate cytidylyltransferase [Alkalicoccus saliphilus]